MLPAGIPATAEERGEDTPRRMLHGEFSHVHVLEHPSPGATSPSSHASPSSMYPSPHVAPDRAPVPFQKPGWGSSSTTTTRGSCPPATPRASPASLVITASGIATVRSAAPTPLVPEAATVMSISTMSARVAAGGFRTLNENKYPEDDTSPVRTNSKTPSASAHRPPGVPGYPGASCTDFCSAPGSCTMVISTGISQGLESRSPETVTVAVSMSTFEINSTRISLLAEERGVDWDTTRVTNVGTSILSGELPNSTPTSDAGSRIMRATGTTTPFDAWMLTSGDSWYCEGFVTPKVRRYSVSLSSDCPAQTVRISEADEPLHAPRAAVAPTQNF
mmetsp:Transcript_62994/g.150715  ORF Transcript_62994/g.150715 Transcript_62994/m.150715 type:complete len:333 (+) Transcript_62994:362-1360(+)